MTDHEELLKAIKDERSASDTRTGMGLGRVVRFKEIGVATLSIVVLISTVAVAWTENNAKPNRVQVQAAIVEAVAPIAAKAEETAERVTQNDTTLARIAEVDAYQSAMAQHNADRIDHAESKDSGPPPALPPELKAMRLGLLR